VINKPVKKLLAIFVIIFCFLSISSSEATAEIEQDGLLNRAKQTVDALMFIRDEINDRYQTYLNTEGLVIESAQKKLVSLDFKISSLREQLKVFDENIRRAEINLSVTEQEIKRVQMELADWYEIIEVREVELARSQQLLDEFVRLAYAEMTQYTDWQTGEISPLKFLLANQALSETEMEQLYLAVLQNTTVGLIANLQQKDDEYKKVQQELLAKRGRLVLLQQEIFNQKNRLEEMRVAKRHLLAETRGEERGYQQLIKISKKQQSEILIEIEELKKNLSVIDKKLSSFAEDLGEEKFKELLSEQSVTSVSGMIFPNQVPKLAWPASPRRGITAYFLDSEYVEIFGVQHHAIDFRLRQGSRVAAAAPGIVYRAKNNGYGYSYIMLIHPSGLVTVYGHISKIFVKEGDMVQAGKAIGLSGGTPGTLGAGYMTTGPHLHFEVIENSEHVNPLDYLPLEQLPLSDIPEKYLENAESVSELP